MHDFDDELRLKGPFYNLVKLYDKERALVHIQYYEGEAFELFDANSGAVVGPFLSEPFFSDSKQTFAACGSSYDEPPTAVIFSRRNGAFQASPVFKLGSDDETGITRESVEWKSETEVRISTKDSAGTIHPYRISRVQPNGNWEISGAP